MVCTCCFKVICADTGRFWFVSWPWTRDLRSYSTRRLATCSLMNGRNRTIACRLKHTQSPPYSWILRRSFCCYLRSEMWSQWTILKKAIVFLVVLPQACVSPLLLAVQIAPEPWYSRVPKTIVRRHDVWERRIGQTQDELPIRLCVGLDINMTATIVLVIWFCNAQWIHNMSRTRITKDVILKWETCLPFFSIVFPSAHMHWIYQGSCLKIRSQPMIWPFWPALRTGLTRGHLGAFKVVCHVFPLQTGFIPQIGISPPRLEIFPPIP